MPSSSQATAAHGLPSAPPDDIARVRRRALGWTGAAAAASVVLGMAVVLIATRWGIGASPDSAAYIGAARRLIAGHGLTLPYGSALGLPLTQFPPGYPAVLGALALLGGDPEIAARGLGTALLAANALVVAALLWKTERPGRAGMAAFGAAMIALAPTMLIVHSMAWSEGLCIFLGFAGLVSLTAYLQTTRRRLFWLGAVLVGSAAVVRLAGTAFIAAGVIGLFLMGPDSTRRRMGDAALLAMVAGGPILCWLVFFSGQGTIANRALQFHPIGADQVLQALGTFGGWLLIPQAVDGVWKLAALAAFALVLVVPSLSRGASRSAVPVSVRWSLWFAASYLGLLIVSASLFDANIPWDDRLLSPVFVAAVVVATYLGGEAFEHLRRQPRFGLIAVFGALILGSLIRDFLVSAQGYRDGLGFRHRVWRESATVAYLDRLPQDDPIYTNAPEAVYLLTGLPARGLPRPILRMTGEANPDYLRDLQEVVRQMNGRGAMVLFDSVQPEARGPLLEATGLAAFTVVTTADGVVLHPRHP